MGEITIAFLVVVGLLLLAALAVDLWDRHHGRDPKGRVDVVKSRREHQRKVKVDLRSARLGAGNNLEAQFQPPPDDHDIAPERRRRTR